MAAIVLVGVTVEAVRLKWLPTQDSGQEWMFILVLTYIVLTTVILRYRMADFDRAQKKLSDHYHDLARDLRIIAAPGTPSMHARR